MIRLWTFQKKVTIAFAVLVGFVALTTAVAIYALHTTTVAKDEVISFNAQGMIEATRLEVAAQKTSSAFRGYVAEPEERFLRERDSALQEFAEIVPRLQRLIHTEEGARDLGEIHTVMEALRASQDHILAVLRSKDGRPAALSILREEALPLRDRLTHSIDVLVEGQRGLLDAGQADSNSKASRAGTLLICLGVVAVVFASGTAILLGRSLSKQIGGTVQHVQSSSAELQTSANQQASGAKETATAMNEITTTVSELLVTSRQIAGSAQQVAHIAEETLKAAQAGDQAVLQSQGAIEGIRRQVDTVVSHMLNLGKKSQQIGGVLDIINELAEQTNILSIAATIEAAGAGEQGKRFAVVGEEIRKLADRVSGSTKESRALVEEIRAAVNTTILATEAGSKAVDTGLLRFEELTRGFKQIAGMGDTATQAAREIGRSTKQQMTAVEQVNAAISSAAQVTRETEASSAQTLQTATQLAQLSQNLSRLVQSRATA